MNLDRTFCSGNRCRKTEQCDRYKGNLYRWLETEEGKQHAHKRISIASFADHDGHCDQFLPKLDPLNLDQLPAEVNVAIPNRTGDFRPE